MGNRKDKRDWGTQQCSHCGTRNSITHVPLGTGHTIECCHCGKEFSVYLNDYYAETKWKPRKHFNKYKP